MSANPVLRGGDIIVFSGTGFLSNGIKVITNSVLSHSAMVLDPLLLVDGQKQHEMHLIESTIQGDRNGVQINTVADRVNGYDVGGRIWALLLEDWIRAFLDWDRMWALAMSKVNKDKYNILEIGAYLMRTVPALDRLPILHRPNPNEEVCSELIAELLRAGGLPGLRPYEMPPQKLAELRMYKECVPLLGEGVIRDFNTV